MNIGEAGRASGVSAKMIRYYEGIGLIERPARTGAGYRVYAAEDVHTLQFIGRARAFGLSMAQVKQLVSLWRDRSRASGDVKRLAMQHVAELREKVAALSAMADTLQGLADRCHGGDRPECPILDDLAVRSPVRRTSRSTTPTGSCSRRANP